MYFKKSMIIIAVLAAVTAVLLIGCGEKALPLDYGDEISFENDLKAGKNLEGKTVRFVAAELHPQSAFGYDIWAGEHLNFVSQENPDIEEGQTVTVKVTKVNSVLGSWIISYEKVKATENKDTIFSK